MITVGQDHITEVFFSAPHLLFLLVCFGFETEPQVCCLHSHDPGWPWTWSSNLCLPQLSKCFFKAFKSQRHYLPYPAWFFFILSILRNTLESLLMRTNSEDLCFSQHYLPPGWRHQTLHLKADHHSPAQLLFTDYVSHAKHCGLCWESREQRIQSPYFTLHTLG